jgi:hypothetical protein
MAMIPEYLVDADEAQRVFLVTVKHSLMLPVKVELPFAVVKSMAGALQVREAASELHMMKASTPEKVKIAEPNPPKPSEVEKWERHGLHPNGRKNDG